MDLKKLTKNELLELSSKITNELKERDLDLFLSSVGFNLSEGDVLIYENNLRKEITLLRIEKIYEAIQEVDVKELSIDLDNECVYLEDNNYRFSHLTTFKLLPLGSREKAKEKFQDLLDKYQKSMEKIRLTHKDLYLVLKNYLENL